MSKNAFFSCFLFGAGCLAIMIVNLSCNPASDSYTLDHHFMANTDSLRWEQDSTVLVMAGNVSLPTLPVKLTKGKYTLRFKANGTMAVNVLPHFVIHFGEYVIKEMSIEVGPKEYNINFELPHTMEAPIVFSFDNDFNTPTEDRNIFLSFPVLLKPY